MIQYLIAFIVVFYSIIIIFNPIFDFDDGFIIWYSWKKDRKWYRVF
jgi:hypothetical protein